MQKKKAINKSEAKESTAQTSAQRVAFLKISRDAMIEGNRCLQFAQLSKQLQRMNEEYERARQEDGDYTFKLPPKRDFSLSECLSNVKTSVLPDAKPFIQSYKKPDERARATDLVAQWMTALDAIGLRNYEAEILKFETLANRMALEL